MDGVVENLALGGPDPQAEIATQHRRIADATAAHAAAMAALGGITPRERYLSILCACLSGRVHVGLTPTIESFLRAADELADGVRVRFPDEGSAPR